MSRRTKHPSMSRRSRRAEQPQPVAVAFAFDETQQIVSNPIFYCGNGPSQPEPPADQPRCVYGAGAVRALVHDPAATAAAGSCIGKPLPLPPCRAHCTGPAVRVGSAVAASGPHGRVLRRAHQDPFLAAYVACSKSSGGRNASQVKQPQRRQKKKTTKNGTEDEIDRGCGIWNGWAAGAKCAGAAMSCKNGCAVNVHAADAPAATAKREAEEEEPAGPTLDLSWAPVVLSARALERRREQR